MVCLPFFTDSVSDVCVKIPSHFLSGFMLRKKYYERDGDIRQGAIAFLQLYELQEVWFGFILISLVGLTWIIYKLF